MKKLDATNNSGDGIDRRGFLRCMGWAGAGMVWTITGGVPTSKLFGQTNDAGGFHFAQISDSHIGFNKPANTDVNATLQIAIDKLNALSSKPDFILHTGDLTHMAKPSEFDTLGQLLQGAKTKQVFYVPGEHDILNDNGQQYR